MLNVEFQTGQGTQKVFTATDNLTSTELWKKLDSKGFTKKCFYVLQNGRLIDDDEEILIGGSATILPRFVGGKGGFGSMLRAIGAQIEKTTNREACRDLSGRRLRDINEEKRLKVWIERQATRKEEAAEKKKKKLERLCTVPKTEFQDKKYDEERSMLAEKIDSAVEEGFKVARTVEKSETSVKDEKKGTKRKFVLDDFDDIVDSDEISSSDEESSIGPEKLSPKKKLAVENLSNIGCSNPEKLSESSPN